MNGSIIRSHLQVIQILEARNIPQNTKTDFNCHWENYDLLCIQAMFWSNIRDSVIVPKIYFQTTAEGKRPQLGDNEGNTRIELWQNGVGKVTILSRWDQQSFYGADIWGYKLLP